MASCARLPNAPEMPLLAYGSVTPSPPTAAPASTPTPMPSPAPPRLVATRPARELVSVDTERSPLRDRGKRLVHEPVDAVRVDGVDTRSDVGARDDVDLRLGARLPEREVRGALVAGDGLEAQHGRVVAVAVDGVLAGADARGSDERVERDAPLGQPPVPGARVVGSDKSQATSVE
eukprot:scaffold19690_cov114-Isochrysis_galbana.AAC.1